MPVAIAALDQLLEWTVPRIAASLRLVTDEIEARATEIGLTVPPAEQRAPHMLGVRLPVEAARAAAEQLGAANVVASVRGPSLRIAPHLHANAGDVDRLVEVLRKIA